jgi:hypothetical protein
MKKLILTGIWLLCGFLLPAQELEQNVEERLQTFFKEYTTHTTNIGTEVSSECFKEYRDKLTHTSIN